MRRRNLYIIITIILVLSCGHYKASDRASKNETPTDMYNTFLLVGTYTEKGSAGIYVYEMDSISGKTRFANLAEISNPSYLAVSNNSRFVYSISEESDINTATISCFAFNALSGKLTFINKEQSGGSYPCYLSVDDSTKFAVVANYGGSFTAFSLENDGAIGTPRKVLDFSGSSVHPTRQAHPHIHCVVYSPDNKYIFATDLGTDLIYKYKINKYSANSYIFRDEPDSFFVGEGEGPRHLTFHPNGKYAYLITELGGNVIVYDYEDGNLTETQKIKADKTKAEASADIHVSPDGRFLYASNRKQNDGIAIYSIDRENGKLTEVGYQNTGKHPRNFVITENGKFLLSANRDSDNIQVFKIDPSTGLLKDTHQDIEVSMPVCLKFATKG